MADERDETQDEALFSGSNAPLLTELRRRTEAEKRVDLLRDLVKIKDEAFIQRLVALDIRPEQVVSVMLVPLVLIAWADGSVDERERTAIMDVARQRGHAAEDLAGQLLRNWLAQKPDARMFAAWKANVGRLWNYFTAKERWQMRQNILQAMKEVAESSGGGFLGLGSKVSADEKRVMTEIQAVLD